MSLPWPELTTEEWYQRIAEMKAPGTLSPRHDLKGNENSGNWGHAGRKGEVGGSAPSKDKGKGGITFEKRGDYVVGTKPDGGTVLMGAGKASEQALTKVFGEHKAEDVVGQMIEHLPGHLTASYKESAGGDIIMSVQSQGNPPLGDAIDMMRVFKREDDGRLTVWHHYFELPEAQRGLGTAKAVLADSMRAYKELGVTRIMTNANLEVGGYAWAKFGFQAVNPSQLRFDATHALHKMTIPSAEKTAIISLIESHADDPKLPWHIAGITTADGRAVGKEVLLKSNWDATLPLDDKDSMARFDHYVGGR